MSKHHQVIIVIIGIIFINFLPYFVYYDKYNAFKDPQFFLVMPSFDHLRDYLSYIWDDNNLGNNNIWSIAKIPFFPIFYISKLIGYQLSVIIFSFILICANAIGIFYFLKEVILKSDLSKKFIAVSMIALFASLNPFTAIMIISGNFLLAPYMLMPIMLVLFYRSCQYYNFKYDYKMASISILLFLITTVFFNPAIFFIFTFLFLFLSCLMFNVSLKKIFINFVIVFIVAMMLSSFFVFPVIFNSIASYSGKSLKNELSKERFYSLNSKPSEVLKMTNQWAMYFSNGGYRTFEFDKGMKKLSPLLLLFPIISVSTLFLYRKNGSYKKNIIGMTILLFFGIFLSWGENKTSPLGNLFSNMIEVSFFDIFRNNYKFVIMILISYVFLCFYYLLYVNNAKKKWKIFGFILFGALLLSSSYPFWSGNLFNRSYEGIPNEILDASSYINLQNEDGRVMIAPGTWMPSYKWIHPEIQQPIFVATIDKELIYRPGGAFSPNILAGKYIEDLYFDFLGDIKNKTSFLRIKWIILDRTLDTSFFRSNVMPTGNFKTIENRIEESNFSRVYDKNGVSIYKNDRQIYPQIFISQDGYKMNNNVDNKMNNEVDNKMNNEVDNDVAEYYGVPNGSSTWKWVNSSDRVDYISINNTYLAVNYSLNKKGSIALIHYIFNKPINIEDTDFLSFDVYSNSVQNNISIIFIARGLNGKYSAPITIHEIKDSGWKDVSYKIPKNIFYDKNIGNMIDQVQIGVYLKENVPRSYANEIMLRDIKLETNNTYKFPNYENIMEVEYIKLNPTLYKAHINSTPSMLVLSESYDPLWVMKLEDKNHSKSEMIKPIIAYDIFNGFWINRTGDVDVTIEYEPQKWFDIGIIVSIVTLVGIIIYLAYNRTKRKI